jgi:lysyl-tRNA synthetase class 2
MLLAILAAGYLVWLALRPWREDAAATGADRREAAMLVERFGRDTLSYFALRRDKRYFFSPDRQAVLAYRLVAGVALVSARERAWQVAVIGAAETSLPFYRARGFREQYEGDEAIVRPEAFSLEGRAIRKVRQSVHRLERQGYGILVREAGEVGPGLRRAMQGIADLWRGDKRETGFSMEMDRIFAGDVDGDGTDDDRSLFVIAVDADGIPQGFLHFVPAPAAKALSLSSMRRYRDTPNGLNEFLIVRAIEWARDHGIVELSLNFAAFASILEPVGELRRPERLARWVLLRFQGRFQLTRLLDFNQKFAPEWRRRYVVFEGRMSLPRVALAAMLAEAYLRPPRLLRRRRSPG